MAVDILTKTKCEKATDEGSRSGKKYSDGRGLSLFVRGDSKTWSLRYTDPGGRRREMSLGIYPDVNLAEARKRRDEARAGLAGGTDPQLSRQTSAKRTVAAVIDGTFASRALKGGGEAGRWMSPMRTHVIPAIGQRDIADIVVDDLLRILEPIWRTKPNAAKKCLQRLKLVMDRAVALYPNEIDATIIPRLKTVLGQQDHEVVHIPSMPWREIAVFYGTLKLSPAALALRLLILTASRPGPVRLAHVDQFNGGTWTVPAANMKSSKEFRIPLSDEAQRVIDLARPLSRDGFLFCAVRGKPISDVAMTRLFERRQMTYRPHGFRSSFRDWATENEENWVLAEKALAHTIGTKTQQAYDRTDALEQRRPLMQRWSDVVCA